MHATHDLFPCFETWGLADHLRLHPTFIGQLKRRHKRRVRVRHCGAGRPAFCLRRLRSWHQRGLRRCVLHGRHHVQAMQEVYLMRLAHQECMHRARLASRCTQVPHVERPSEKLARRGHISPTQHEVHCTSSPWVLDETVPPAIELTELRA